MLSRLFRSGPAYTSAGASAQSPKASCSPTRETGPSATGSLFVAPVSEPSAQSCVYLSCRASVRAASEPWAHELRVSREGDDNDEDPNSLVPDDIAFPIDAAARVDVDGTRFAWSDRSGKKRYNLDLENEAEADALRIAVARALYEDKNEASADKASEKDLDEMLVRPAPPKPSDLLQAAGELFRADAELYHYDIDKELFVPMDKEVVLTINSALSKEDKSRSYLVLIFNRDSGSRIIENEVDNSMSAQFYAQTLSMVWLLTTDPDADPDRVEVGEFDPGSQVCLSLKFSAAEDFVRMQNQFAVCLYEVTNRAPMESFKLNADDRDYILNSARDEYEPMDIENDNENDEDEELSNRQLQEDRPAARTSLQSVDDGYRNSQLALAFNNDRTFVVRGDKLGVLSHAGDEGVEHKTTVLFRDPSRQNASFKPTKVMLHEKDASMLLLDESDPSRVMKMDLERGEVVETWGGSLTKNTPVSALQRTEKYANLTHNQEFMGLNKNQLLRMDPRSKEFIVQSKTYAAGTRARLEAFATTGAGYVVTASENGDIRLFDAVGKNAKTHLPGLGDRVIGIDVTEDGNFVLATTQKYLLVIDTRVKGETKGGFQKSMGKNKPQPIKLTINPTDQAKHRMGEILFTTAHFNTGSSLERSIVTSTGPFIVTWSFRLVKQGKKDSYQIRRYRDNVVADDFAYNNDGKIVVTLPHDVTLNNFTPRKGRRSSTGNR